MTRGVTLLELSIAMAIMLVVVGAVVVGVNPNNTNYRNLNNASRRMQADLRYAQRRAVTEGRSVDVVFQPQHNRYYIRYHHRELYESARIRTVYFQNGVRFLHNNAANFTVRYTQRGTVYGSTTIWLSNGEGSNRHVQRTTINVSGGRVHVFDIGDTGE